MCKLSSQFVEAATQEDTDTVIVDRNLNAGLARGSVATHVKGWGHDGFAGGAGERRTFPRM
jgi:hypothetical protein